MAKSSFSLSCQMSPATGSSPEQSMILPAHSESVANLANLETLRTTLALTRKENYWRLTHANAAFEIVPEQLFSSRKKMRDNSRHQASMSLVTALDISQRPTRPPSRNVWQVNLAQRQKSLPTDRDYRRMLNKLDKIINGSALSFRSTNLIESKPTELSLDTGEWQFLKIRTEGMQIPLRVSLSRSKGRVLVYVSKTAQEPNDLTNDEIHSKDVFLYSESGLRFKQAWLFLGVKCLEEATLTISVRFGLHYKKHKSVSRLPSLTDLNELRKDDTKRQALMKHVDSLLSLRQEAWANKCGDRDFIKENKETLGKAEEEIVAKRDLEQQRREETLKRHIELLKEKKSKAKLLIRRQELRLEAEAKARMEREEKERLQNQQRQWLSLLPVLPSAICLWETFSKRKADLELAGRQVKAAMVLQRCYRRVCITINPKRLAKLHVLHHLTLYVRLIGPDTLKDCRTTIFGIIRDRAKAHRATDAFSNYYKKMTLIQVMWKRYINFKQERLERLVHLWNEAINSLLVEQTRPHNKKNAKKTKELEAKYMRLDRDAILKEHLKVCQRQYYKSISSYIKANKAFRKGIKAFIFSKLKKGEAVYLSGAPDFHYVIPLADMQKMILEAASSEAT